MKVRARASRWRSMASDTFRSPHGPCPPPRRPAHAAASRLCSDPGPVTGHGRWPPPAGGQVVVQAVGAATRAGRTEIVVTGPGHQRSKAALDADIRAPRRTALAVNVRSGRGRRHFTTVHRRLQATAERVDVRPPPDPRSLPEPLAAA